MSLRASPMICATVTLLALGGCVDNDRSLSINRFVAPSTMNGGCIIDPMVMVSETRGVWDVSLASVIGGAYFLSFAIQNNTLLVASAPIDTQSFYVNSYDVELEPQGAVAAAIPSDRRSFNFPTATVLVTPGAVAGGSVDAVPADLAKGIAALSSDPLGIIVAHIRPVATRAEEEVHGAYVSFPIELCKGCLAGTVPACPLPMGTTIQPGNPCNYSQDQPVTCCTESTTNALLCGASAPIAAM